VLGVCAGTRGHRSGHDQERRVATWSSARRVAPFPAPRLARAPAAAASAPRPSPSCPQRGGPSRGRLLDWPSTPTRQRGAALPPRRRSDCQVAQSLGWCGLLGKGLREACAEYCPKIAERAADVLRFGEETGAVGGGSARGLAGLDPGASTGRANLQAFASEQELAATIAHESFRLATSQSAQGLRRAMAASETSSAYSFAEKVAPYVRGR
jgi:hypothetical protein